MYKPLDVMFDENAKPLSKLQSRNLLGAFLGVNAGFVGDAGAMFGASLNGDWSESEARAARRAIPFNNIFYLHQAFGNNVEESFGGKPK